MGKLDLLPVHLREQSISPREIVLPLSAALEAIDFLEAAGVFILGWEGWVKTADGRHGHGTAPQGWSTDPRNHSVPDAAELCRNTIPTDAAQWAKDYPDTTEQLHVCITVRA
jgi:hypothetical protein